MADYLVGIQDNGGSKESLVKFKEVYKTDEGPILRFTTKLNVHYDEKWITHNKITTDLEVRRKFYNARVAYFWIGAVFGFLVALLIYGLTTGQ